MARARIFLRPKTAMQSGTAGTENWVLEYEPSDRERNDPLMGWWGSMDTRGQVKLRFDTREAAIAFAEKNGLPFEVEIPPKPRAAKPKVYADNFRYGRVDNWTH